MNGAFRGLALGLVAVLFGCSGGARSVLSAPQVSQGQSARSMRLSSSSDPRSFASLVGKNITDSDIDRFIDPTITGSDRVFAKTFMRWMPKNWRGDFVYISSGGRVLSNRPEIRDSMARVRMTLPGEARSTSIRPATSCYAPAGGGTTGPYLREYSNCGVTAVTAYVTIPCNDAVLGSNEGGFVYSGEFGESSGAVDAGLVYTNLGAIEPFMNPFPTASNVMWTNQGQRYQCGGDLELIYAPYPPNYAQLYLVTGIPSPLPASPQSTPPPSTSLNDAAWVLFDKPSADFSDPGIDSTGDSTDCMGCVVKRMTSIGQNGGQNGFDGSCFGACLGPSDASIIWGPVVMGHVTSCSGLPFCSMEWWLDGRWYGGLETWNAGNPTAINDPVEAAGYAYEGINLDPHPTPTPRPPTPQPSHICHCCNLPTNATNAERKAANCPLISASATPITSP
jgi:hypothetical protein